MTRNLRPTVLPAWFNEECFSRRGEEKEVAEGNNNGFVCPRRRCKSYAPNGQSAIQHRRPHENHKDDDADDAGEFLDTVRESEPSIIAGKCAHHFPSISDHPRIDSRYLSHPMDLEMVARHIQLLSKLLSAEPLLEGFNETGTGIPAHAFTTGGGKVISLKEAKSITREQLISNYHPMGSFMIALKEKERVVGEALSVYGMRGLRVVDASVFSVVPRGVLLRVFTRRQRRRVT